MLVGTKINPDATKIGPSSHYKQPLEPAEKNRKYLSLIESLISIIVGNTLNYGNDHNIVLSKSQRSCSVR